MKKKLKEGAMSELNLAAQESATYADFVKRVIEDFPQLAVDINRPAFREFLQSIYNDAKSMNESKLDIKKIIREEVAKALQSEAVNPELDSMVKRFVAGLATKYSYGDRDAVMAIFEGLKRLGLLDKTVNYKAPMMEGAESAFEDEFALDNSKGGTDNSMNKIHRQLLKLQTQMNELMVLWKEGKMDLKTYVAKRKPLQDLRNKLEASLVSI